MDAYALNPTIAGALIGGGAALIAVIVSALGTAATLRANRVAARDERLWEKRTALYEELLGLLDPAGGQTWHDVLDGLTKLQPRIAAYATDNIRRSCWATFEARQKAYPENERSQSVLSGQKIILTEAIRAEMIGKKPYRKTIRGTLARIRPGLTQRGLGSE